jgi:hypothetical protein
MVESGLITLDINLISAAWFSSPARVKAEERL